MVHALPIAISIRVSFRRGAACVIPPAKGQHCYQLMISPTCTFAQALQALERGMQRHKGQQGLVSLKGAEARGKMVEMSSVLGWCLMNAEIFRVGVQATESGCCVM